MNRVSHWIPVLGILIMALVAYLATMPRLITLEDAGLFQMVCHLDGLSHPPGYPLFTLLCNQMVFSSDVFSGNLISTLFALCTILVFYFLVLTLSDNQETAIYASFAYAFSATFWSQAILIEVYSLAAFLFVSSWYLLLKYQETEKAEYWYFFCFVTGLGFSNHWPLHMLSGVALLGTFIACRNFFWAALHRPRFSIISVTLLLLGLSPYLSLLLNQDPEIAVFGPVSVEAFLSYVSRNAYVDHHEGIGFEDKMQYARWLLGQTGLQFGLLAVPFVLYGAVRSWKILARASAWGLLVLYVMTTFVLMSLMSIEYSLLYQAVFKPYPIIAYGALSIWFGIGLKALIDCIDFPYRVLVGIGLLLSIFISNYPEVDRSASRIVDDYSRLILNSLPKNAVLFVKGDNETSPIGYLNRVVGERPDVTVYDIDSLVFSNRLTSAYAKGTDIEKAFENFLQETTRPVYKVSGRDFSEVNYGLFHKVVTGKEVEHWSSANIRYEFRQEFDPYLDFLLRLHEEELLYDIHEELFVYYSLIRFTRQYLGASLKEKLEGVRLERFARLQNTFPGLLVTLETMLRLDVDQKQLLPKAILLESKMTKMWPNKHIALSYQYFGLVYERLNRLKEAEEKFRRSIEIDPLADNLSYCHLSRITNDIPQSKDASENRKQNCKQSYDAATKSQI